MPADLALDQRMMRRCIDLATSAKRSGNTPVGCVVTLKERIVAEADEQCLSAATHSRTPTFFRSRRLFET